MRLISRRSLTFLFLLACSGTAAVTSHADKVRSKHVFIISFDGGKPSVMQTSKMPVTMKLMSEGAGTWEAQTIVPSITLPSHTSMLTGVKPDKHKILWNDWRPDRGVVTVPTVFGLAKAQGLTTALFAGKEKFKHLNVAGTIDDFAVPEYACRTVALTAVKCIVEKKPALCFIHFADSDGAGHSFGWGSKEQVKAFEDEDSALQLILDGIERAGILKDSVIILTADHGGHGKTHGSTSPEDMNIPWIVWGTGVTKGAALTGVNTCDTAATALWLLGVKVPLSFDGKPVTAAFKK